MNNTGHGGFTPAPCAQVPPAPVQVTPTLTGLSHNKDLMGMEMECNP